jgi:gas vesicle protein
MTDETEVQDEPGPGRAAASGGRGVGGFATGVMIGAVLGIGLGMLFAPARGDATRRRLRKRLARLRERADDRLQSAGKRTRKELARRRERLEEALERLRERGG